MPKRGLQRERTGKVAPKKKVPKEETEDDDDEDPQEDRPSKRRPSAKDTKDSHDNASSFDEDDENEEDILPEPQVASPNPSLPGGDAAIPPAAKFQAMQKVLARDNDGVMYEAVIRRALYGRGQPESIQLGFCSHAEAQLLQEQALDEPPCWHYFIHYNQWRSNWDRWVREYDVYPSNEATRAYVACVVEAHKKLRHDMTRKIKGKKSFQSIDGTKFLAAWRQRLNEIDAEHKIHNPRFDTAAALQKAKQAKLKKESGLMSKVELLEERKLRERGLTKKRRESEANAINLPFGLKRALVEQWEIITQCSMLTDLPAQVTVRHALDEYLRSKGVDPELCQSPKQKQTPKKKEAPKEPSTTTEPDKMEVDSKLDETTETETDKKSECEKVDESKDHATETPETLGGDVKSSDASTGVDSLTDKAAKLDSPVKDDPMQIDPLPEDKGNENVSVADSANQEVKSETPKSKEEIKEEISEEAQGWIDMANGVCQFFDEALPCHLLYREEYPQLRVVQRTEELADKPYSEIYGCEYLLRMLTRLPDVLMKELSVEECRPIFAKLNDLARFLHKNQSSYFAAYHRKPTGDEQMEAMRMEARKQKKRQLEQRPPSAHRQLGQRSLPTQKLAAKKAKVAADLPEPTKPVAEENPNK